MADDTRRNETLSARQETALGALLAGATITEAAGTAGVARQTVSGWANHDFAFMAELRNRRAEVVDALRVRLESLGIRAVQALEGLLDDDDPRCRLAAGARILDLLRVREAAAPHSTTAESLRESHEQAQTLADLVRSACTF
jgi:hypothetical protein